MQTVTNDAASKNIAKKIVAIKAKDKAAKAKKTAKPSKSAGPRTEPITSKMAGKKIKLMVSENPKREGTKAFKKFQVYKNGMTIEKALELGKKVGFRTSTLHWDLKHKYITLH